MTKMSDKKKYVCALYEYNIDIFVDKNLSSDIETSRDSGIRGSVCPFIFLRYHAISPS